MGSYYFILMIPTGSKMFIVDSPSPFNWCQAPGWQAVSATCLTIHFSKGKNLNFQVTRDPNMINIWAKNINAHTHKQRCPSAFLGLVMCDLVDWQGTSVPRGPGMVCGNGSCELGS